MLLDVTGIVLGIALGAVGFVVVIAVTALVLRLIGVVMGSSDGDAVDAGEEEPAETPEGG